MAFIHILQKVSQTLVFLLKPSNFFPILLGLLGCLFRGLFQGLSALFIVQAYFVLVQIKQEKPSTVTSSTYEWPRPRRLLNVSTNKLIW